MKKLPICRFARLLAAGYQAQAGSGNNQIEVEDGNIPGNKLYFNVNLALDPLRKKMK